MDEDNIREKRKNAGKNSKLDNNYLWPPAMRIEENVTVRENISSIEKSNMSSIEKSSQNERQDHTAREDSKEDNSGVENANKEDNRQPDEVSHRQTSSFVHNDKPELSDIISVRTKTSVTSSEMNLRRKKRALELEKIKQTMLESKMKILELEDEIHESEIAASEGTRSTRSITSNKSIKSQHLRIEQGRAKNIVIEKQGEYQKEQVCEEKPSEIKQLCETISNAIKTVAAPHRQDRFMARQVIDKDVPYFDGNPQEWPTFIAQFRKISQLCDYSNEEKIIKLQKCLKGEAKQAVAGLMVSPENIPTIIKTLEMRFGRPELIIDVMINKIREVYAIREHNLEAIINLSNHVSCFVATIKSLGYNEHLQNPMLLRELIQKLPDSLKLRWGEEVVREKGVVDLEIFATWIENIATAVCYVSSPRKPERFDPKQKYAKTSTKYNETFLLTAENTLDSNRFETFCNYCRQKGHKTTMCEKMKADDVDTRWDVIVKQKLCFSCLNKKHRTMKCRLKTICGIDNCPRSHHKLLHKPRPERLDTVQPQSNENVLAVGQGAANILLRMVRVKLYNNNRIIETVALCDEASTVTLVDRSITEKLCLKGKTQSLNIQWTSNLTACYPNSCCVDMEISGVFRDARTFNLKNVRSVENLCLPHQVIRKEDWKKFGYLDGLPFEEIHEPPMILLGQDSIRLTVPRRVVQGPESCPVATKTHLGWIFHGRTDTQDETSNTDSIYSFHIFNNEDSDERLHQLVKQSFTTEAFGVSISVKSKSNRSEDRATDILKTTAKRVGKRFEIGLLWKTDDIQLPNNKKVAIRRLEYVERQMQQDPEFKKRYNEKILSYVEKGYARKLTPEEAQEEGSRSWYLPHFGVINPNKPGKLRLVFDAASKSGGVSLNDNLLAGPDLLQSLLEILLKFRQRKIAFCSDVKEMFHQIRIRAEDRSAQRFLWRNGDSTNPLQTYEMQVMTFGATCSPTCAQYVKNLNAQQLTQENDILDAIIKKHYVDDYLDCTDSTEEAEKRIAKVKKIMRMGGFELVNWTSNSAEVMKNLAEDKDMSKDLNPNSDDIQRILGLKWDPKLDNLLFTLKFIDMDINTLNRPTKRQVLKIIMSVFDPLGFIVNLTICGRILVQDIWKSGIGWDDYIDEELHETWLLWLTHLKEVDKILIPRCYSLNIPKANCLEMHVFCDASKKAFAAAAYLRTECRDSVDISLIMAKARVAPTKPISIPRLELQAAVMGSRLVNTIVISLELKISRIYLWSDSTTVLHWIKGDGSKLGQFESHRIGEIQETTNSDDWRWVPTKFNVADMATRTCTDLKKWETWFNGPSFLKNKDKTTWPTTDINFRKPNFDIKNLENSTCLLVTIKENTTLPDINRFSKWSRLIRSTAWVLRFCKIMTKNRNIHEKSTQLTVNELEEARKLWIVQCQKESFFDDVECLKQGKEIGKQSRLRRLFPKINEWGILVLSGRTNLAPDMAPSARNPIILPNKHRYTRLLLQHYHEKYGHQGMETILNEVRQQYWVIDGRSAIKSVFSKCQKCRIRKAKPETPVMGQLPVYRLTPHVTPFTFTGLDYFGPILVTVGRRKEKRWGALFTCLTIRAIHLEIAHSLTTDSAIMAVRRMSARRGQPRVIYSDNGTNFRGASEELKSALKEIDHKKLTETLSENGIDWKFLPPAAPHMAGVWERMVRSVKSTLKAILNGQTLRDELLQTLFAEVENIINSRPLTRVSNDPDDLESLTPNHLLLGTSNGITQFGELKDLRLQWRKTQNFIELFWKRWTKEYLPTLTKHSKWNTDGRPIKQDDIVIIVDENVPRKSWRLGKVINIYPGPDGKIRVVDVKTLTGILRRPVSKLCRIEIEGED